MPASVKAFEAWLDSCGCFRHPASVTRHSPHSGWGMYATGPIAAGERLFHAPAGACLGATTDGTAPEDSEEDDEDDDASIHKDSQLRLARALLVARAEGADGKWATKLALYPETVPCPWAWPASLHPLLDGTELQTVLASKNQRLSDEFAELALENVTREEYAAASAVVASHACPWFGTSLCPFNDTLNWSTSPNVEFDMDEEEGLLVGTSTCDIVAGDELTQPYCDSVTELVYR